MTETDELKAALRQKSVRRRIKLADMVSTGCTLLNLACSGRAHGGFIKGKYYFVVGDSTSGKTWLALSCMAEASINPNFDKYDFYHDDVEDGALMDLGKYFGQRVVDRIYPPSVDADGEPVYSSTVESFYFHLDSVTKRAKAKKRSFIYDLDSQDALTSEASDDKFQERKAAFEKGNEVAGSYGDGKAKAHSENIRRALVDIRDTKSILIINGQTRDNLGMGMDKKTRSGGRSLRFYATLEIWLSLVGKLRRTVRGEERIIGVQVEARIRKNRITGKDRTVTFAIYHSHGIDDVGSNVDYLLEHEHWKMETPKREKGEVVDKKAEKKSRVIKAEDLGFTGTRDRLIAHIEEQGLEKDLAELVQTVWDDMEAQTEVQRKNKYA